MLLSSPNRRSASRFNQFGLTKSRSKPGTIEAGLTVVWGSSISPSIRNCVTNIPLLSTPVSSSPNTGITLNTLDRKLAGTRLPPTSTLRVAVSYVPTNDSATASPPARTVCNRTSDPRFSNSASPQAKRVPSPSTRLYRPIGPRTENALIALGASNTLKSVM